MISIGRLFIGLILLGIAAYTISYGTWNWNNKNKLGAVAVYLLVVLTLALPVYIAFFIR